MKLVLFAKGITGIPQKVGERECQQAISINDKKKFMSSDPLVKVSEAKSCRLRPHTSATFSNVTQQF